jgi:hypothetical protein
MAKFVKIGERIINIDNIGYIRRDDWNAGKPYTVWMIGDTEYLRFTEEDGKRLIEKVTE